MPRFTTPSSTMSGGCQNPRKRYACLALPNLHLSLQIKGHGYVVNECGTPKSQHCEYSLEMQSNNYVVVETLNRYF